MRDPGAPMTMLRLRLRAMGYDPLPAEGKVPPMKGWQEKFNTCDDEIRLWERSWHLARNSGVLARHTPSLDIDIMDPEACEVVESYVTAMFENQHVLVRIGQAPKRLIPFSTPVPFKKLVLNVTAPNGAKGKIEFLGDGQQFIVDGIHPDTHAAYTWHGGHLADVARDDLPVIRDGQHAQDLLDELGALLVREFGYTIIEATKPQGGDHEPTDWADLTKHILDGVELHDSVVKLAASHAAAGMPEKASTRVLRSLMLASNIAKDERWQNRFVDIDRTVRTAQKFAEAAQADSQRTTDLGEWDAGDGPGPIPPRQWFLANQFCAGFISSIVAAGGAGKTSLRLAQFLSLAAGRPLCSQHVFRRCRVLVISLEDDRDEVQRRIAACLAHYNIPRSELKGWLFCATPRLAKLAVMQNKTRTVGPLEQQIRAAIARCKPDLISLDPFVKTHALEENNSGDMDFVCDLLARLAVEFGIAVDSPHHAHKGQVIAGDADSGRGSSGIRDAGRLIYTLTPMSEDEASAFNVNPDDRCSYIRLDSAKVNITARSGKATWFKLVSVNIGNGTPEYPAGDNVQVVEPWLPPDTWAGLSTDALNMALSEISRGLVDEGGKPDGRRYSSAPSAKGDRPAWLVVQRYCADRTEAQCREIVRTWEKNGVLMTREYEDPEQRRKRGGLYVDDAKRPGSRTAS